MKARLGLARPSRLLGTALLLLTAAVAHAQPPAQSTPPLSVQVLETGGFSLEGQGLRAQLIPRRHTTLAAGISGRIASITVREGERFSEGQVLLTFSCTQQSAQLDKAEAELAGAINNHRGNQHLAELNAIGQVELTNSDIEVRKARADLAYMQATLVMCTFHAPFDGRAGELKIRELEYAQEGQPLIELIDDSALELEFIVPSRWLVWLTPDYPLEIYIDETGQSYPARLQRTAARVDPVSQSVKSIAVIVGEHPELIAGMSGRVQLTAPESLR
jgi:RND family efflux transporter MFP subunit